MNKKKNTKKNNENAKIKKNNKNNKKNNFTTKRKDISSIVLSMGKRAPIDSIDAKLIRILLENGRLSNVEIANILNTSEATIRRRIQTLRDRGIIRGFTALLDYKNFGHVIMTHVFMQVKMDQIENVANKLADMENSCSIYRVIGNYNLSAVMVFKNIAELQEFLDSFSESDHIEKLNYLLATAAYKSCMLTGI